MKTRGIVVPSGTSCNVFVTIFRFRGNERVMETKKNQRVFFYKNTRLNKALRSINKTGGHMRELRGAFWTKDFCLTVYLNGYTVDSRFWNDRILQEGDRIIIIVS